VTSVAAEGNENRLEDAVGEEAAEVTDERRGCGWAYAEDMTTSSSVYGTRFLFSTMMSRKVNMNSVRFTKTNLSCSP